MKKEVDNGLKLIGHYEKCLKNTKWAIVEELSRFSSPFQDFTDLVSISVTSLSLIQLIRKEIIDLCKANPRDCKEVAVLKLAVQSSLDKRLPLNDSVILAALLDPSTKNLLTVGQGEKMDRLLSAVKDHVESEADSSSTSMEVEDSPAGSHDESKPISKRRRLLHKHRVDVPVEEAIRAEMSYLQYQADDEAAYGVKYFD